MPRDKNKKASLSNLQNKKPQCGIKNYQVEPEDVTHAKQKNKIF